MSLNNMYENKIMNYYGHYYKSALYPTLRCLDRRLVMCGNARKKYWHMSKMKWVAIAMPIECNTNIVLF